MAETARVGAQAWLRACLAGWPEAPAVLRAVAAPPGAAGRYSMARLLPEREVVVQTMPVDSAEATQSPTEARTPWQQRHGAPVDGQARAPAETVAQGAAWWVDVGHRRRGGRAGFRRVGVQRGESAGLGNPFHMRLDGRGAEARRERPLREAVCEAFGELLRREPSATAVAEVAAAFGGLAFDHHMASGEAARGRLAAVLELAQEVRRGGGCS